MPDAAPQSADNATPPLDHHPHRHGWRGRLRAIAKVRLSDTNGTKLLATAIVGFMFGIASSQVSDFVKRADDCYAALSEYQINLGSHFAVLSWATHDSHLTEDQKVDYGISYNTLITVPASKIFSKCPVDPPHEYLHDEDVAAFHAANDDLLKHCYFADHCSREKVAAVIAQSTLNANTLARQAHAVSQWGLVRRGWYALTHLY